MADTRLRVVLQLLSDQFNNALNAARSQLGRFDSGVTASNFSLGGFQRRVNGAIRDVLDLGGAVRGLATGFSILAVVAGVRELIQFADNLRLIEGRIRLASVSTMEFVSNYAQLVAISLNSHTSFAENAQMFARINSSMQAMGGTSKNTLQQVDLLAKSLRISNAGIEESASAVRQWSQAAASGLLRGDELNSMFENAPRLVKAISDGLGVNIGVLRAMGEAGELTFGKISIALASQGKAIDEEFKKIPLSIGGAWEDIRTRFGQYVADVDKSKGATTELANGFEFLAQNMGAVIESAITLGKLGGLVIFSSAVSGVLSYVQSLQAARAAQAELAATQIAAQQTAIANAQTQVANAQATAANTAARVADLEATNAVVVAARAESLARLQATNSTIAQSRAAIAAMQATVQTTSITALLTQETNVLAAAEARRGVILADLAMLGRQNSAVSAQLTALEAAQTNATNALTAAQERLVLAQQEGMIANKGLAASFNTVGKAAMSLFNLFLAFEAGRWIGEWARSFPAVRAVAVLSLGKIMTAFKTTVYEMKKDWLEFQLVFTFDDAKQAALRNQLADLRMAFINDNMAQEEIINDLADAEVNAANGVKTANQQLNDSFQAGKTPQQSFIEKSRELTKEFNAGKKSLAAYTAQLNTLYEAMQTDITKQKTPFEKAKDDLLDQLDKATLSPADYQRKQFDKQFGAVKADELMPIFEQINSVNSPLEKGMTTALKNAFDAATAKYQLPKDLLQSHAFVETGGTYQSNLTSSAGAVGLMQFMPDTAARFGVTDRTNPLQSIEGAAKYLRFLLDKFKGYDNQLELAIAAYNAGEGSVTGGFTNKKGVYIAKHEPRIPNYPETQNYVPAVLKKLDDLSGTGNYTEAFKNRVAAQQSRLDALAITAESAINSQLAKATATAENALTDLKLKKEQGLISISDYYAQLTTEQTALIQANISATQQKLSELARQQQVATDNAQPQDLPKIAAEFAAKKQALNDELAKLNGQKSRIEPANLFERDKELRDLDSIINQANAKIAELRGETEANPVAIKARLEIENRDMIEKLRLAGQGDKADQFIAALGANEQADIYQSDIGKVQQRTQIKENRINLLQESGAISGYTAQQQLKTLYEESAQIIDDYAAKLTALGDNTGFETVKLKAEEAQNAALQLRQTIPSLGQQFVNAGQTAAISSMTDTITSLANGTKSAGQAFKDFAIDVVSSLQKIAAQKLAEMLIGKLVGLGGALFGAGAAPAGGSVPAGALDNIGAFAPFAEGGLIQGAGTGTSDSIRAVLPEGSFILNAKATAKIGLARLNAIVRGGRPAKVSNGEYYFDPQVVKARGVAFFNGLNAISQRPPMHFASGGVVGGVASGAASSITRQTAVAVHSPVSVTVNQQGGTATDNTPQLSGQLGGVLKEAVLKELVNQQRPNGILWKMQYG